MDWLTSSLPMIIFLALGATAVASSILVVAMRNPVHSALFLLATFLCVAMLFILAHAEFVGAVQLLVYAGGIMVLFLFVVMLANVRDLPGESMLSPFWKAGVGVGIALFIVIVSMFRAGEFGAVAASKDALRSVPAAAPRVAADGTPQAAAGATDVVGNSEAIGMALYQDYLVPFEVASLFLLVAMIGAIVIGKRHLASLEEEAVPQFIADRVAEEKRQKEALRA
ncbi:MAG TPA: NADH-quinone oxidoreductase subunit J [Thermoanaerobaculia bacterium]|nr:NADH-quinone oxidoreductase subunit J [Thermoanaerobaculia bacterium]